MRVYASVNTPNQLVYPIFRHPSTEPRIHNPRLHQLYEQMDLLSDEDQQALIVLMDSLVKRSQISK